MKSIFLNIFIVMAIGLLTITSCNNSKKSTAYDGTYVGTMPCADCSGIYTEITLSGNEYSIKRIYQGKGDEAIFTDEGTYSWDPNSQILTLNGDPSEQYRIDEETLIALDMDGNPIDGEWAEMYILKKK
ncbi:MAG: copper resistance protein NlpE [Tannerella sp.]|jgi:uncharacterized lipoprotein NlpE involved in copper resistance|nr:copper resistance protein NlpE [Tannerella sp.]